MTPARGARAAEDQVARQVELIEGVESEKACAVHRRADDVVLLEDQDVAARLGEDARGDRSSGSRANDDYITQVVPAPLTPSHFRAPRFPGAPEGNPERQHDQPNVQRQ